MVILRTQNKSTDFLKILAWASPFKHNMYVGGGDFSDIILLRSRSNVKNDRSVQLTDTCNNLYCKNGRHFDFFLNSKVHSALKITLISDKLYMLLLAMHIFQYPVYV